MDVSRVLELVRPFFESRKEPYALVGGLALLAYGAPGQPSTSTCWRRAGRGTISSRSSKREASRRSASSPASRTTITPSPRSVEWT